MLFSMQDEEMQSQSFHQSHRASSHSWLLSQQRLPRTVYDLYLWMQFHLGKVEMVMKVSKYSKTTSDDEQVNF